MYFAQESKDDIALVCMEKVDDYYNYLEISGRLYLYRNIYDMYYRARTTKGSLYVTGPVGQYLNLDTGDFRNLLQHLKVLTTQARSTFIPIATNTDTVSENQCRVARGILEYYMKDKKVGRVIDQAAEMAIQYGNSYVRLDWDTSLGETVMVEEPKDEEGNPVLDENGDPQQIFLKDGDLTCKAYGPMDVVLDFSRHSPRENDWYITRDFVNKYEVSAKYRELKDEIEALSDEIYFNNKDRLWVFNQREQYNSDLIPLYTLYHKKTAAVPNGRMTKFLSQSILLFDGDLPFEDIPLYSMIPTEEQESSFGYSVSFDLLPICDALRKLYSTLITTESVSGIPVILMPEGGNMDLTDLSEGIKGLSFNPAMGTPQVLHLGMASPQTYQMIALLKDLSQVVSAINAVARGETPQNLSSGSSLALVLSTAIQFNSGLQRSYAEVSEDIGTGMIQIFKVFAKTKRMMSIAGISNKTSMQAWSAKDIDQIHRVTVELGNPIQQTAGGRMKIAEDMLSKNLIRTGSQYTEVMMTGRLDPMTEDSEAENLYIRGENEHLSNGELVKAILTDEHLEHIRRHKSVMFSETAKMDPKINRAVLDHIQEHLNFLNNPAYVNILQALGQIPAMMPPPMPEKGDAPSETIAPKNDLPNMPKLPKNPMTGERIPNG